MDNQRFKMTPAGYLAACIWLEEYHHTHKIEHELSTDGYTVVALANELFNRTLENKHGTN